MQIILINNQTNIVKAVLVGNKQQQYTPPDGYSAVVYPEDTLVGVNWRFDGSKFIPPPNSGFSEEPIPDEN